MNEPQVRWTLRALEDSPRLHILSSTNNIYEIRSTDESLLYKLVDTRYLPSNDPWYTSEHRFWRCFLRSPQDRTIAEIRRHESTSSDIGIHLMRNNEIIKTGLRCLLNRDSTCRYTLTLHNELYLFETTRQAPNSSSGTLGSIRCANKNMSLAWLTRNLDVGGHSSGEACATIWFEESAIQADLVEMIIASFAAITDTQYPYSPSGET